MPASIVRCRKASDAYTTYQLATPDTAMEGDAPAVTELCTLPDGYTYYSVPDGVVLPKQPVQIEVQLVTLTDDLREAIKRASPHVELINERVRAAIAERYSLADEIKLLRTAPSPEMDAYNMYAEDCRSWGHAEKAKLGL